ncbi:MAG: peptide chain release factor 1 [Candidatus Dadabacteria bacterium]|nr:MAG: peptide chain release factor 1 [Candidatus Dadabacteria bacterium]
MFEKLATLATEFAELNERLTDPSVLDDHAEVRRISQRIAQLRPVVEAWEQWRRASTELEEAHALLDETSDPEMRALAEDEIRTLRDTIAELEPLLKQALIPADPEDEKSAVLEIRAGTGGEEAALFAADLYRMYVRYAESRGWQVEETERNETGLGGLKEVIALIEGPSVYRRLKFESGVHRVQRIPETESGGRIHTSACTVAVLPEAEEVEVEINDQDLRIDTYRAQGAGGQHVNKTESAVRITHIPTGIVVTCQDEKSQHKNRAKALKVLRARLYEQQAAQLHGERAEARRGMVGSGDRSERIRTYNFPQNRVTDHRINLTLHKLDAILSGELDELIDALLAADAAERLRAEEAS